LACACNPSIEAKRLSILFPAGFCILFTLLCVIMEKAGEKWDYSALLLEGIAMIKG
jgi:hypothetical protein